MRAKFRVQHITRHNMGTSRGPNGAEMTEVTLNAVYSPDPNSENKWFADATPSGELKMTITNPRGQDYFRLGQAYYLDFSEAPE